MRPIPRNPNVTSYRASEDSGGQPGGGWPFAGVSPGWQTAAALVTAIMGLGLLLAGIPVTITLGALAILLSMASLVGTQGFSRMATAPLWMRVCAFVIVVPGFLAMAGVAVFAAAGIFALCVVLGASNQ